MRQSLQMDDYFIPRSEILNNPSQHSQQSIETERRRVVRMSMDSLIGQNGGRPSEAELQSLARLMASHYPSLRDKPLEALRDNYVSKLNLKNNFLIFNNHSNIYSKKILLFDLPFTEFLIKLYRIHWWDFCAEECTTSHHLYQPKEEKRDTNLSKNR